MSEPALFVLVSNGGKRYFADRWAAVFLFRELLWGPTEFERWVLQLEELDEWSDDFAGGAVVDFDQRRLVWSGVDETLQIPKVRKVYDRLLHTAWPGYEIQVAARGMPDFAAAAGIPDAEDYDSQLSDRYPTVREAAGFCDDDDDDDDVDAKERDPADDGMDLGDNPRAWITMVEAGGAVRHRQLLGIPGDLLAAEPEARTQLVALPSAEIPAESQVLEGMWLDERQKRVGIWGGFAAREALHTAQQAWQGWSVHWAENGYAEQCRVSGPGGIPMSDTEALAEILPIAISTRRFDVKNMIGALGSQLKQTAIKATGCLVMVICLPVVLFAIISGNWKAAGITIGVVCALAVVVFKAVELRFRSKFGGISKQAKSDHEVAPVAGPLVERERRQRLDALLQQAGFPPLKDIEPKFSKEDPLELLN